MLVPPEINASGDRSFAAYTLRNRLPHILRQIIQDGDYLAEVVGQLEVLGTDILDGTITSLSETEETTSVIWPQCLQSHLGKTWFEAPFFFVEMYFYRRIIDIIDYHHAPNSESCDPFITKKRQGFTDAQPRTRQLADWLATGLETSNLLAPLQALLLANLWSNCADLSQLPETFRPEQEDSVHAAQKDPTPSRRNEKLLVDDGLEVSRFIVQRSAPLQRVDIILDNTGIELTSDLALADFLLRTNLAQQVILHAKNYPVFVSDATLHDIRFTIREMATSSITAVAQWGQRLHEWLESQRLDLQAHPFWTLPLYFDAMLPDLRADMSVSDLWIVKGDANYRRLVGDRHWPLDASIDTITQYLTAPCLALRVLKCELLVGMDLAKLNSLELEDDWMTNGTYGIIQFIS